MTGPELPSFRNSTAAAGKLADTYNIVSKMEFYLRRITGIIFLLTGFYLTLKAL